MEIRINDSKNDCEEIAYLKITLPAHIKFDCDDKILRIIEYLCKIDVMRLILNESLNNVICDNKKEKDFIDTYEFIDNELVFHYTAYFPMISRIYYYGEVEEWEDFLYFSDITTSVPFESDEELKPECIVDTLKVLKQYIKDYFYKFIETVCEYDDKQDKYIGIEEWETIFDDNGDIIGLNITDLYTEELSEDELRKIW